MAAPSSVGKAVSVAKEVREAEAAPGGWADSVALVVAAAIPRSVVAATAVMVVVAASVALADEEAKGEMAGPVVMEAMVCTSTTPPSAS